MTIQDYVESKKDYIIQQYKSGISSTKIAKELQVNSYYISKILNYNGVQIRNQKKFTTKEINKMVPRMKEMFENGLSICQISQELGTDENTTSRRLQKEGCDTTRGWTQRKDPVKNHTLEIIDMYNSGLNCRHIAKKFESSGSAIWRVLNDNNIKCRKINKYSANYDYFDKIDSDESSYILGLLYADGHVKTNTQVWGIGLIDKELVEEVAKRVKYTGKIHYKKPSERFEGYISKESYELAISSPQMKLDLIKLGCIPNKTFLLQYPTIEQVPLEFRNSFIRGYLDGDGSITYSIPKNQLSPKFAVQFTGTKEMCNGIMNEILDRKICNPKVHVYKASSKNDKNTYYCVITGVACVEFLDWIYKDSTIHLDRKWRKYMQLKEYFEYKHLLINPSGNKPGWKERQKIK